MNVSFRGTDEPPGVAIVDPIEQRHFHVATSSPVAPTPADDARFVFPVDETCRLETDALRFDCLYDVYLRRADGSLRRTIRSHQTISCEPATHYIEVCGPVKLYCRVDAALTLRTGADYLQVEFADPVEVVFGARSYHDQPAATVTTTDDPRDVMRAVSTLSSALKTTACERAYPTLRGHPPLIERGEEFSVPSGIDPPDTGVRIEVPPRYRHVYTVSSLAFYLGAEVVPGEKPRLVTADGFEHDLGGRRWFEDEVARVLKQVVFLDCIVRTEGLYKVDLHERRAVAGDLHFDPATLYDEPLRRQVATYLQTPFAVVEPHLPTWCLTAHVAAAPEHVEALPFIANDLGVVREPRGTRLQGPHASAPEYSHPSAADGGRPTCDDQDRDEVDSDLTLVEPAHTDESVEHAWFGDHVPRGASKATIEAFTSRLRRKGGTEVIDIVVVCNDEEMRQELEDVETAYGARGDLPYDVQFHSAVETDDLATLLQESETDFFHYIGHATPGGLECPDGDLDVRTLSSVSVEVFLLNACRSYEQALALAERGAIGGVGTLGDVVNEHAIETGKAMANLLNLGFPLRAAISLVREHTRIGDQYLVVGDGSVDIAQVDGGPPLVCDIAAEQGDDYAITVWSYPTRVFKMGATMTPTLDTTEEQYLLPGQTPPITVSESELTEYLTWSTYPVRVGDELRWNNLLSPVGLD